jgi:hypothetical protein
MSKERELLQRILDYMWEGELADEIKELLAQPEQEEREVSGKIISTDDVCNFFIEFGGM